MRAIDVARKAAREAGRIAERYFREGVVVRAGSASYNLVSDADVEAEQAIADVIRQAFPEHAVLGEESHRADVAAEHLWIVDPLDGTNNFAHGIPHWAVSVAYYHRGQAQCGVVYNPLRDDWFTAARDEGAQWNGRPARVSSARRLDEALIAVGFYYDRGAMMQATLRAIEQLFFARIHGIRRFGTASLDLCQVGVGMFGGFFEYQLAPWDFAAGRLFVELAGGTVSDCRGGPLPLAATSVLASNGHLHQELLRIVERHLPP